MNVSTALAMNTEAAKVMQPGMRAFDDLAIFAKPAAMFGPASSDHQLAAARLVMSLRVVSAIGVDSASFLQCAALQSANWWNRVDQRQQLRDVVNVRSSQDRGKWDAVGIGDDARLGSGSRAIDRVWSSFWPAPTVRIDEESTAAREKSIWLSARSFASSSSCRRSHAPAACQSRNGRRHVTPIRTLSRRADGPSAVRS